MITLAFYKGRSRNPAQWLTDWVIRTASQGQYSHVEFIAGPAMHDQRLLCLSASGRDGGVRAKHILLKHESWDLVELLIDPEEPARFIQDRIGAGYDYTGILLSQVLSLGKHDKSRWFCSEIIAASLGMRNPQRLSPQSLFDVVTWTERSSGGD